jgi:drug/metabolite transporter (DMT)-like permease
LTGYLALGYALGHLPASVVSPTMLGQPVLTALLAIPILGESLHPVQWIGGLVVLGGIYLVNRSRDLFSAKSMEPAADILIGDPQSAIPSPADSSQPGTSD